MLFVDYSVGISSCLALITFPLQIVFLIGTIIYILRKNKAGKISQINTVFTEELKNDVLLGPLYKVLFLTRRFLFAFALVVLNGIPLLQIVVLVITNLINFIYLIVLRPFERKSTNIIEIINECFIIALVY